MDKLTAKDVARTVEDWLNCFGDEHVKELVQEFSIQHRTAQQLLCKMFLATMKMWAEKKKTGEFDGRNQATVEFAEKVIELVDREQIYLPMI